ncbi:MAG TPA: sugar transferase [Opitutus sp.]|nr:sugar transferase [Opitutus sp.]
MPAGPAGQAEPRPARGSLNRHFVAPGAASARGVRERRRRLVTGLIGVDLVLACGATFAALQLGAGWNAGIRPAEAAAELPVLAWSLGAGGGFVWLMLLCGGYEVADLHRVQAWLRNFARALLVWAFGVWAVSGLFPGGGPFPGIDVVYGLGALTVVFVLSRCGVFLFLLHPSRRQLAEARMIMVGWNSNADQLRTAMRHDPGQLQEIIGCVPMPDGGFGEPPPPDVALLGEYDRLPEIVRQCHADGIILSEVNCASGEIQRLVAFCQREFLIFRLVPRYFPALVSGLRLDRVRGVPLLGVGELPCDRLLNRMVKRAIDIVGGLVGLVLSLPLIAVFGALVRRESAGPIIFRQQRTSRGGRIFTLYKIRSMRIDAEAASGAVWCRRDDPRRLKIGAFMRRYNIDELPQFWNVLKGDMSLVGPRPERPELIARFKDEIPNYNVRHEVRAGLTGWAQIQGLRGDTDLGERIRADIHYLENWSVFMDLYCLAATFFTNRNAQ